MINHHLEVFLYLCRGVAEAGFHKKTHEYLDGGSRIQNQ